MLSTLDLENLIGDGRGRKPVDPGWVYLRPLTELDLPRLIEQEPTGRGALRLTKLRNTHHALARALAEGRPNTEAALLTGFTPSRISCLRADPAFQELMAYYKDQKDALFADFNSRMASFGLGCLEELQERFDDEPEEFTKKELADLIKLCADVSQAGTKGKAPAAPPSVTISFIGAPKALPEGMRPILEIEGDAVGVPSAAQEVSHG